jgi:hypothetical protein
MDQPTPASLVGRWVDTPAHIFRTQGDAYRGNIVSIDSKRAKNVVVIFQDDPTLEYFVPVTSVVEWLVDPRNHHSDDEELLRTGIQVDEGRNDPLSDSEDEGDDAGGEENSGEPLDVEAGATQAPKRKAPNKKSAEQKEIERKVAEATEQVFKGWEENAEVTKDVPGFEPGNVKPGMRQEIDNKHETAAEGFFYMFFNLLPMLNFLTTPQ